MHVDTLSTNTLYKWILLIYQEHKITFVVIKRSKIVQSRKDIYMIFS